MSAVYDDVKRKAMQQQARGFTTMLDEAGPPVGGMPSEYSSSSLGHYIGSAFLTGAVVLYATHGDENAIGKLAKVQPVRAGQIFPFIGQTDTSSMSLASPWLASEPEVYNSGVLDLPWSRKVLFSGELQFATHQLQRRPPRTIIADDVGEENG
jgi:hypothetical protein